MTSAQFFALCSIAEGRGYTIGTTVRDQLMALGLVGMNAKGALFVTAAGGRVKKEYAKRVVLGHGETAARRAVDEIRQERREIEPPALVVHDGELVSLAMQCATVLPSGEVCRAELGSHRNRLPRPHPGRGCPGFSLIKRREVA